MPNSTEPFEPAPPDGRILIYQDGATRLQLRPYAGNAAAADGGGSRTCSR